MKLLAQITVSKNQRIEVKFEQVVTSLALQTAENQSFRNTFVIAENDTFKLQHDADFGDAWRSNLVVFSKPISSISLHTGELSGQVVFHKIYVSPFSKQLIINNLRQPTAECEKPNVVPISVWRAGLTPPKETPIETKVRQIIVHHSAGSNTATNYVDVVRNIYEYHTLSNGWNDIGYNFLIAQDGTIFEGRDGQGKFDGDNVLGAHYCAKNTGTMGICVLGDYMTTQPTTQSLESLEKLIAWKMKKDNLDPLGKSNHATSGELLNNISGHRNGCDTECPGDNLYAKLDEIRKKVPQFCPSLVKVLANDTEVLDLNVYPNPSSQQLIVESSKNLAGNLALIDANGRAVSVNLIAESPQKIIIPIQNLAKGLYLIRLVNENISRKILIE